MKKLLLPIVLFWIGCPSGAPPSDPPPGDAVVDVSQNTARLAWSIHEVFPEIELPEVLWANVPDIGLIPDSLIKVVTSKELSDDPSLFNKLDYRVFLVAPGDYSYIPRKSLQLTASGTKEEPRMIISTAVPPWEVDPLDRATFEAFEISGDHWVLSGLEFSGDDIEKGGIRFGGNTRVLQESENVVFDNCLWRNSTGIRMYGDYHTVQRCLFKDKPEVPIDIGGVGIYARDGEESRGNRVVGCEFIGMSDGIGIPWDTGGDGGSTPATIIAFNYSWTPEELYRAEMVEGDIWIRACTEDGYDFKNGAITNKPADRSYFIGNVSRGHRATDQTCGGSGSTGVGWILHRRARNWLIAGNLSYDDTHGCFIKGYSEKEKNKDKVQHIIMTNNVFAQLDDSFPGGKGGYRLNPNNGLAIRMMCPTCVATDNIIAGADKYYFTPTTA